MNGDKPLDIVSRLRNYTNCHDGDVDEAADEIERLRKSIVYWSYCTWSGMLRECPEKREELKGFLGGLDIGPYRNE